MGVVENMSGMVCPHCNQEINLFKTGGGEKIAQEMDVPFLGRIPLDPQMVVSTDNGSPFVTTHPDSPAAKAFDAVAKNWGALLAGK